MGGRGSGGRRTGAGRKKKSTLERAISGPRGVVLQHPTATAVAPIVTFDPPAELQATAATLPDLTSALESLQADASAEGGVKWEAQIADLQARVTAAALAGAALAIWHELAPHAFAARTLTPATTAAFVMLCRGVATERTLAVSSAGGPNHRGMMHRVATWMKDFSVAPLGKPLYEAEQPIANPLERFTNTRA